MIECQMRNFPIGGGGATKDGREETDVGDDDDELFLFQLGQDPFSPVGKRGKGKHQRGTRQQPFTYRRKRGARQKR